jgi:hypothetical protein
VGVERGPLSLVSTTEELLRRKSSSSGLKTEITAVGILCADHATSLYLQNLVLTSPTNGSRSVGIARSRTQATESICRSLSAGMSQSVQRQATGCLAFDSRKGQEFSSSPQRADRL